MKALIEKWRARAAVEARASIAAVYLECADQLEQVALAAPDMKTLGHRLVELAAQRVDRDISAGFTSDLDKFNYTHSGAGTYTADRRPLAQHEGDPTHALPAERL